MYKVVYSKFRKAYMVVGATGIAQSSWTNRVDAFHVASQLNMGA